MQLLNPEEIKLNLDKIYGWFFVNNSIEKEFILKTFSDAVAFILKVAIEAEKNDHHPNIHLHSWNKVKVVISTHSAGGVTEKDFKLAQLIDEIRK